MQWIDWRVSIARWLAAGHCGGGCGGGGGEEEEANKWIQLVKQEKVQQKENTPRQIAWQSSHQQKVYIATMYM